MMKQKVTPILLKGMSIYTETNKIETGYIKIKDQKIVEIGPQENLKQDNNVQERFTIIDLQANYSAIPGFIDIHIHGANGADAMDATPEALATMAKALVKEGTTSFLATTMTQETAAIEQALTNAGNYITQPQPQGQAEIIGIHLEGPFVNKKRAGAQPLNYIIDPDKDKFTKWNKLANGKIKLVTLASERPGGLELVRYLTQNGIVASLGHTDATYDQVDEAIQTGAKQVTHLYNQMRELHHREPGVVGAAYLREELKTEIIVDGIHSRPEMVKLAYKQKGKQGFILITDAMRAKGLPDGDYELGGQPVAVKAGKAVLADGTIAGSVLKMNQAIKNMLDFTGCSFPEAIEMAAMNPAKQLNIADRKGSLAVGKDADIVILDENLDVFMTICRGKLAYQKGGETA